MPKTYRDVAGIAVWVLALACSAESSRGAPASQAKSWRNWGMVEAEIYFSAMDTLVAKQERDGKWFVADSIYWWPLAVPRPRVSLEATPVGLSAVGRENKREITLIPFQKGVATDGARLVVGPLLILGPIDMIGEDEALFRVNLYLGRNGQELNRVRSKLVNGRWTVVEISPEVMT